MGKMHTFALQNGFSALCCDGQNALMFHYFPGGAVGAA
jgi:hypothetical protein